MGGNRTSPLTAAELLSTLFFPNMALQLHPRRRSLASLFGNILRYYSDMLWGEAVMEETV
jgi:hypothetical protein